MTNLVGQQLGNYRLTRLLGVGGFAEIYLGEQVYLDTQAAIKVLQTRLATEEQENFLHEARIIARLIHPHIIRLLEFGIEAEVPYLVMDYAPNGTLRDRFPREVPLEPSTILPYLKQVAGALDYAHAQHLVHRDVKPENMLLGRGDEVLLSDFGIALLAQNTRFQNTQEVFGTASYMAPEQIQGKAQPASDQYALGVVLYEWLSGIPPFHGTLTEVCSQHLSTPPPPLHEKVPGISPAVEVVVEKALAKDPGSRYPSVEAMVLAFEEASWSETLTDSGEELTIRRPTLTADTGYAPTQYAGDSPIPATQLVSVLTSKLSTLPSFLRVTFPANHGISRRMVVAGGIGLAGLAVAGGLVDFILSRTSSAPTAPSARFTAPPSPTASASIHVLGSTLLTYRGHTDAVYAAAWSPNGQYLASASADTTVRVWNTSSGETLVTYYGHAGLFNGVFAVGWASNGSHIASGGADKTVQVWDAANGNRVFSYHGHSARVLTLAWSPDVRYIASGGADKTVQVWDAATGTLISTYRGHTGTVYTLAWSSDGKYIASGSADATVQIWNAMTGEVAFTYHGHVGTVYALAVSPDGRNIASTGADRTVQVWNAANGKHVSTYHGHVGLANVVSAVTWSLNGKRIASGGTDKTVQIWDAASGKTAYIYREHTDTVFAMEWSPAGPFIASGSADTTVRIWQSS
ncbi:MAG: serine/threonine-protein kinase [Ktedonobacteraceae bacterium]